MDSVTVEEASGSLKELLEKINSNQKPCRITLEGDQAVIVIAEEMYDNLLVTLEFLSTPGLLDRLKS